MSKDAIVIILGLAVAAMPFLGFPSLWKTIILVALGISIAVLVFLLRQEMFGQGHEHKKHTASEVYVENGIGVAAESAAKKENESHGQEAN